MTYDLIQIICLACRRQLRAWDNGEAITCPYCNAVGWMDKEFVRVEE